METVTRKRLGKAVLLSLLLMNVCKEGGATEYNSAITGNETDYDSIKEVDIVSGEVKYTFTGENTVENKGSNSFQPIKVSGKTVTVAVGDKLTLTGKGTGVSPLNTGNILATGSTGSLTFTGGTLDVTDLTEYPKSNYTIHANSGASIVFDNAVTNIGEGNLTQSSMGIMVTGAASKVIFTENADSLKINSATGIYVNGGSFSFDNTEGSVLIENNPEDRKRDTGGPGIEVAGGSLTLKGRETVIKTTDADGTVGGAAVSVTERDKDNILNFEADKTILTGGAFGIYVDGSLVNPADTIKTNINFSGETQITAYNNDGLDDYVGCVAVCAYFPDAKINFAKQAVLMAETNNNTKNVGAGACIQSGSSLTAEQGLQVNVKTAGDYGYGLFASGSGSLIDVTGLTAVDVVSGSGEIRGVQGFSGAEVKMNGAVKVAGKSDGGAVTGLWSWNGGKVEVVEDAQIKAVSDTGNVIGINSNNNGGISSDRALTQIGGNTVIEVAGAGSAAGISCFSNGDVELKGAAAIKATSTKGTSMGISANTGGKVTVDKAVTVHAQSGSGSAYGVYSAGSAEIVFKETAQIVAETGVSNAKETYAVGQGVGVYTAGGKVDFQKGLILDNKGQSYALRAYKSGASIAVNSEGSGSVYLTGNIQAHTSGLLDLNLLTDDSYYEGAAAIVSNGQINMKLRNGAFWKVTGNSDLTRLDFGDNAVIDMEQAAGYQKLQTGTLNGDRGTFVLGADISTGQSDTVSIGSSDAKGTYNILVSEVGRRQGDDLHLLLVNDASGEHTFIASDIYRGGIYVYKTEISNENDGGIKWYLESLHNETTEDARSILQTADSMYSSWVLSSDMLQGRLDELKETRAEHGLWARINNGKLRGEAFKNNYQTYQIGYDTAFKDRDGGSMNEWLGGAAFEYAKGNMSYGNGSGEQQTAAVMLYGSKHSQSGDRVDIVLKHGQMKGDIDTFGIAADRRDYKSRATALSLEYGKRFQREQGVYLEPQAQLLVSHINGEAAVTDYGIRVESEGINSAVGRIGLEVGQKYQRSSAYIKASLLHEFGGRADTVLTLGDETLCDCRDYSGSWWELNLGGELELGRNNDLYFDVARSFGGAFQKQWQINAGVRFSF